MDYYQGVMMEYLRADRAVFINSECFIQLEPGAQPPADTSWFCDAVAINLRLQRVHLCEVTYASSLTLLLRRLGLWRTHWQAVRAALVRDCHISPNWPVSPWVFLPNALLPKLQAKLPNRSAVSLEAELAMPAIRVTVLEKIVPWSYRSWDRQDDGNSSDWLS